MLHASASSTSAVDRCKLSAADYWLLFMNTVARLQCPVHFYYVPLSADLVFTARARQAGFSVFTMFEEEKVAVAQRHLEWLDFLDYYARSIRITRVVGSCD